MFWTDELIKNLDKKKDQLVDDAWSTSGFAHIGSLRGAVIHQIAYKALKNEGFKVKYTFILDDFDPFDGIPAYLDKKEYEKYLGQPLCNVPAPEGSISLAEYFGNDFKETLKLANVEAENPKTSELYKEGKLNDEIKTALDNAEKIRDIYKKVSGSERPSDWHPFTPICEKCGKIGSTRVFSWDGEKVSYKCEEDMVEWAKGCGHEGSVSPYDGNGKLPWRVEWPARWRSLGITVEGEGKDHWSAGGSREMADILSKEIFKNKPPYDIRYDFFVIGGKKMSSSKGTGITARKMAEMLPGQVLNFLLASAPKKTIEFDPKGDTIPRLFDQYDGAREAHFGRIDFPDKAKAFEISQIKEAKDGYVMRFSKVAYAVQMPKVDVFKLASEEKGATLSESEKEDLEERIEYAKKWLKEFAPEDYVFEVQKVLPNVKLNETQKEFLDKLAKKLETATWDGQEVHTAIHDLKKETEISPKDAFSAIYFIFLGKDSGPQAGWLLSSLDKEFVLKRIKESLDFEFEENKKAAFIKLGDKNIFFFDEEVKKAFPDLKIGIAIIKDIKVQKKNEKLEAIKENKIKEIYDSVADVSLSEIPELDEYRKIYKQTGVDPTKRMPSPFALLKRLKSGKEIYNINTVVDAYNIVVMEHKVSLGAFNLEKITSPVTLTFSKKGDKYLPLLAEKEEEIGEGELTWEDAKGTIICRSLNYRDSEITKVDENTRDIIIYVDGTKATNAEKIQNVLDEAVSLITEVAGGKVELKGVYI